MSSLSRPEIRLVLLRASVLLIILFVVPIAILDHFLSDKNVWDGWRLGVAGTYEEFCERNHMEAFLRERMNSWSNLGFVWFGLVCVFIAAQDRRRIDFMNTIKAYPVLSVATGLSLVYLGIGSLLYHASLSHVMQRWDMSGTYAAVAVVVFLGALRVHEVYIRKKPGRASAQKVMAFLVLLVIVDVLFYIFKWHIDGKVTLVTMIVLLTGEVVLLHFSRRTVTSLRWAILALVSMSSAFTLWLLDFHKVVCDPDSLFQGHAVWHVLCGLSIFCMYTFFRKVEIR